VLSALLTPLFMPLFLIALVIVVGKSILVDPVEKPLSLAVEGAEYAPGLVQFLHQHGASIHTAPQDPRSQVRSGIYDVILVIPPDYAQTFQKGQPAPVQLIVDSSRQSSAAVVGRVRNLLSSYNQQIGALRLLARGISPSVTSPLAVGSLDVATPQSQTLIFLNIMPFLIVVVIFMGGMYVVIDTTAGERERGSLEPLLINPATREEFILGKLLASIPFAAGSLILTLVAFWAAFDLVPLEKFTGFPMKIDVFSLWLIFWISLPMIWLASGLQMVIATFTRSFKEAQTYLALLPLIAGLPGAFMTFLPVRATVWTMLIPAFSQSILINQAMRGETIQTTNALLSGGVTLALSLALVWIAVKLYQSERILFGR
jgi:sodium transport system permease protein